MKVRFISFMLILLSNMTYANEINFAHISTSGVGEISVTPDSASFDIQIELSNLNAEQAKNAVDDVVKSVTKRLVDVGESMDNISSSNLFVAPQYYYPKNGQPELIGYKAVRKMTIDVSDIASLNQYLDIALEEGVTRINRIELKVRDREKFQQMATTEAIKDAEKNAQILAKGFNRELGEVWQVRYQSQGVKRTPAIMRSMSLEESNVFKDYQDTNIVIKDNVDVIYKLK